MDSTYSFNKNVETNTINYHLKKLFADREHMGLTTWKEAPDGKIQEYDVTIAKNYLSSNEKVATVSSGGKVTAKGKGTCYIYAYAHNGVAKQVKITVR